MEKLYTKNGHQMFEISSLIQKAIRRGDMENACYAANEMERSYRPYLWKRLLITSAEDCYDLTTGEVNRLKLLDDKEKSNLHISKAVSFLVMSRKNRDADYFACNLLHSKYKKDCYPCGGDVQTRHGHNLKLLCDALKQKILESNDIEIGYLANEIRQWYRGLFWVCVKDIARKLGDEKVIDEIRQLEKVDLSQRKETSSTIFIAKAITTLMKIQKYGYDEFQVPAYKIENIEHYSQRRTLPAYTFDCHTWLGKRKGLTDDDFIVTEQKCLNPLQKGEYDDLDWANSRKFRTEGRGNDFNVPKMDKSKYERINKGIFDNSLFDFM